MVLQCGQYLVGLVCVVVDGLFVQDYQVWLFFFDQFEQGVCGGQWLDGLVGDDVDGMVCIYGQVVVQVCLGVGWSNGGDYDFVGDVFVVQVQCFFQGDFIEGIGGQFDVVGDYVGIVWFDLNVDVVVYYVFVCDEDFYLVWGFLIMGRMFGFGIVIGLGVGF